MGLLEKLGSIQTELKAPKGQLNSFGNYKYRSTEDILEAVKPLLAKYKCVLTISDIMKSLGDRYYIEATVLLRDTESEGFVEAKAFARESEVKKGMDSSQITGAASSYARKYALNGLFLIDDTKDMDTKDGEDGLDLELKAELEKYKDPQNLEDNKMSLRDKYVSKGMNKREATTLIANYLESF